MFGKIKLALQVRALQKAIDKEVKMGFKFNPGLMIWKGLKTLGLGLIAASAPVVIQYACDPAAVTTALAATGLPAPVVLAAVPVVCAGVKMAANWYNHKDPK